MRYATAFMLITLTVYKRMRLVADDQVARPERVRTTDIPLRRYAHQVDVVTQNFVFAVIRVPIDDVDQIERQGRLDDVDIRISVCCDDVGSENRCLW